MSEVVGMGYEVLDRMVRAVNRVRTELTTSARLLESAGVSYSIIGGHAVAALIRSVEPGSERNTPNADFLIDRRDLDRACAALDEHGFARTDHPNQARFARSDKHFHRSTIRLLFFGERFHEGDLLPLPSLESRIAFDGMFYVTLDDLVDSKLVAFRNVDIVHLQDLMHVDLVNADTLDRLPRELKCRLQSVLEDPNL